MPQTVHSSTEAGSQWRPAEPSATEFGVQAAVVVFPGSNADAEMLRTLRHVVDVPTTEVWHRETSLPSGVDLVAIPGGFSFGDYLRSGAIAKVSPIVADIRRHVERGGLVLGVCNGFQILTECELLPGALTRNTHLRFECRDIFVKVVAQGPFTRGITGRVLRLPIAHADGRYHIDEQGLATLEAASGTAPAVALRYCSVSGEVEPAANPNGSLNAIAGVYGGPNRNVLGLMPHPERMSEALHGSSDGRILFDCAIAALVEHAAKAPSASVSTTGAA